jgi:large subunit ribosomal protein L1
MEKAQFKTALDLLKSTSEKKKFVQGLDIVVNLKNLDLKQTDQQIDLYLQLHHGRGKKTTVACLCGPELLVNARKECDLAISTDEFSKYQQDKKLLKKLAREYDFFIAQANIMPDVAKTFGRVLGPKGKMPNPKAGAVVPPNANLKPLVDKLRNTLRLTARSQMSIKAHVGKENQPENELLENAFTIYETLLKSLPQERNNIKNVLLKYTMSKPIPVGVTADELKKRWDEQAARSGAAKELRKQQAASAAEHAPKRVKVQKEEAPEAKADAAPADAEKPKKSRKKKETPDS